MLPSKPPPQRKMPAAAFVPAEIFTQFSEPQLGHLKRPFLSGVCCVLLAALSAVWASPQVGQPRRPIGPSQTGHTPADSETAWSRFRPVRTSKPQWVQRRPAPFIFLPHSGQGGASSGARPNTSDAGSSAFGTSSGCPHPGHLTRFPARESDSFNRLPHEHDNGIDMMPRSTTNDAALLSDALRKTTY